MNDGSTGSGWKAATPKPGEWWQIDLESLNSVMSVETTFGDDANYRYKIEASPNGTAWEILSDSNRDTGRARVRSDSCAQNERNRYVRLTITGLPSGNAATVEQIRIFARRTP